MIWLTKLFNLLGSVGQKFNAPMYYEPLKWWQFWLLLFVGFGIGMPFGASLKSDFKPQYQVIVDSTQYYKSLYLAQKTNSDLLAQVQALQLQQNRLQQNYEKAIIRIDSLRGSALQREVDRVFGHAK